MKFVNSALHKLEKNYGASINDVDVEELVSVNKAQIMEKAAYFATMNPAQAFRAAKQEINGIMHGVRCGSIDPMAAVWMVVTIGVSLILGILLMGRFTTVAQSGDFGLNDVWSGTLNSTVDILGSSLSLAGILPFAIIGAAAMMVVGWAFLRR